MPIFTYTLNKLHKRMLAFIREYIYVFSSYEKISFLKTKTNCHTYCLFKNITSWSQNNELSSHLCIYNQLHVSECCIHTYKSMQNKKNISLNIYFIKKSIRNWNYNKILIYTFVSDKLASLFNSWHSMSHEHFGKGKFIKKLIC